jgi:hypothetical protein
MKATTVFYFRKEDLLGGDIFIILYRPSKEHEHSFHVSSGQRPASTTLLVGAR